MSLISWFGLGNNSENDELPEIFPLGFKKIDFIDIDTINIFQKILTDVVERTHGLSDVQCDLLWDNCIQSESAHGLISLLARAMSFRRDLFLVYNPALPLIRIANATEQSKIQADYLEKGESSIGLYVSFRQYLKADLLRLYSALEFITLSSLNKTMNLSSAIQLKMTDMRGAVSLSDSSIAIAQAKKIARGLSQGKDIMLDAKDIIENAKPDLTSIEASIQYLNEKRAFYLGLPPSYLTGEMTVGIGTTGESDTKFTERGLKNYFASIIKPVLENLFDVQLSYKSQDFRQVDQAMNALKTFSLIDDSIISIENQTLIINKLLDLPEDEEGTGKIGKLTEEQRTINNTGDQI